jgi:nucleoside-diphosphate-sugar epimerase
MAAKNIYTQKINDFESFIESNVQTTIKLAEFAKKNKVKKIIFFSSLAIYGQSNLKVINNMSPYYDINFYGLTKLMSEGILRVPGVIDKNQYVPWPWLNLIKNRIKKNMDIRYFNPKKKLNSLTSIDDISKIIHSIDEKKEKNVFKIYNFGGNKPIKIIDILKKIKKRYKSKSKLLSFNNNKHSSIIDNSYIEQDLKIKLSNTEQILNNFLSQN